MIAPDPNDFHLHDARVFAQGLTLECGVHVAPLRVAYRAYGRLNAICTTLDELLPDPAGPRSRLITYVTDRPGHDFRYEIDPSHAENALDWKAAHDFETGIRRTVQWYLDNRAWWEGIRSARYTGQRLGTTKAG